jgi:UDP-N-acetylglucosamine transferase subunit ALG13
VILVAVGTQLPFDRLVETVDEWAGDTGATDVIAQVGPSAHRPAHIQAHAFFPPKEFEALLDQADLIVAHCGMGSILSALSRGKPIIVMPRSAAKGEHRNDHQQATAQRFSDHAGVTVAWDEAELLRCLQRITSHGKGDREFTPLPPKAPRELTDRLRAFLRQTKR